MRFIEDCDSHEFVWFGDERDSTKQVGEYLIESYFCQRCGLIQQALERLDEVNDMVASDNNATTDPHESVLKRMKQEALHGPQGKQSKPFKVSMHVKTRLMTRKGYEEFNRTWTPQVLAPRNKLHISLDAYDENYVEVLLTTEASNLDEA